MGRLVRATATGGLDSRQWQRGVLDISLKTQDGNIIDYLGCALISSPAQGHVIDFAFKASLFSTNVIDIPLFVSSDSVARISVDGVPANIVELTISNDSIPLLHRVTADLTACAEENAVPVVRLRISYKRQQGVTTILDCADEQEYGPRIIQSRSGATILKPVFFFTMAWACVLACAILVVAHVRLLGDAFRFYATLTVAGGWLVSVLGLPDLAKIPLRGIVRRGYAKTRKRRVSALIALALLSALTSAAATAVVYSLTIRYWYAKLISNSLADAGVGDFESIKHAFVLLPWRKEAQILLERHAYRLRTEADMPALHKYVKGFVEDPSVKAAVKKAVSNKNMSLPLARSPDPRWFSDPVVWYAGLLPEAEEVPDTPRSSEAIQLLEQRKPPQEYPEAYMLRKSFELSLRKDDRSAVQIIRKELIDFFETDQDARFVTTFEYEAATDTLAASYIRSCDTGTASYWFQRELEARQRRSSDEGYEILHRPPHKLLLYHMFTSYSGSDESGSAVADRILDFSDGSAHCKPFREVFKEEFLQRPDYAGFKNKAAWFEHTIVDTKLEPFLDASLQLGWRY